MVLLERFELSASPLPIHLSAFCMPLSGKHFLCNARVFQDRCRSVSVIVGQNQCPNCAQVPVRSAQDTVTIAVVGSTLTVEMSAA